MCLSGSSDTGLDPFRVPSFLGLLLPAISVADCERDGTGVGSSFAEASEEPGEPTESRDSPDDLDLRDGGCTPFFLLIELDVVLDDGVRNAAGDPLAELVIDARLRVGVEADMDGGGAGDLVRRNLLVLLRRLRPGVRPRLFPSEGEGESV